jgi:hypothetical protein
LQLLSTISLLLEGSIADDDDNEPATSSKRITNSNNSINGINTDVMETEEEASTFSPRTPSNLNSANSQLERQVASSIAQMRERCRDTVLWRRRWMHGWVGVLFCSIYFGVSDFSIFSSIQFFCSLFLFVTAFEMIC